MWNENCLIKTLEIALKFITCCILSFATPWVKIHNYVKLSHMFHSGSFFKHASQKNIKMSYLNKKKYIKYIWANQISPKSITNFSQSKFNAKMRIKKIMMENVLYLIHEKRMKK